MSQELIAIIGAAIGLVAIVVPTIRGLRKDIAVLGDRTQKDIESLRKDVTAQSESLRKIFPPWVSAWVRWR